MVNVVAFVLTFHLQALSGTGLLLLSNHEHKYRIVERDDEVGGRGGDGAWVPRLPHARDR